MKNQKNQGFTLIELLVVIAIISLLSSIIFVGVQGFAGKARDARRISDLNQIRTAMVMYNTAYGNWIGYGSGCGWEGNGQGWFNCVGGSYPKSIVQCLIDPDFLSTEIIDPTGGRTSRYAYMKYHCTQSSKDTAYVYAKLEGKPQDTTATDGTCCSTCDSNYGMNYYVKMQ